MEFPEWLGTYKESNHEFTLNDELGGGVICFRNLDKPSKYLSSEFAAIAIDELTLNIATCSTSCVCVYVGLVSMILN